MILANALGEDVDVGVDDSLESAAVVLSKESIGDSHCAVIILIVAIAV